MAIFFWAEDEDDGAEGFLDACENASCIYDEQNESWLERRLQGRRSRKGKGKVRSGKDRGRGRRGRKFFKSRRKKKGHYQEERGQKDWSCQTDESWRWQANQRDDGWAADSRSSDQESAHEQVQRYKSKGKSQKGSKGKKGKHGKNKKSSSNVASSHSEDQAAAAVDVPALPASFFAMNHVGSRPVGMFPRI